MSQKGEKYARRMERRVDKLEQDVAAITTEQTTQGVRISAVEDDLAVYRAAVSARELKQAAAEVKAAKERRTARAAEEKHGAQRRLEIARALGNNPHLLLLDEPCAGMNPHETAAMIDLIKTLRNDLKITIVLIEHDMKVVMNISDSILVLDHGEAIAQGNPDAIQNNQRVIEAYLGTGTENLVEKYSQRKKLKKN